MTVHRRTAIRHAVWIRTCVSLGIFLTTLGGVGQLIAQPLSQEGGETPAFLESVQCAICHANSSRATAMRDRQDRGIGSDRGAFAELDVLGVTGDGDEEPLLIKGEWAFDA